MFIAKILLILSFIYKMVIHLRADERLTKREDTISARLATATIFIATILLYYFAGIFNLNAVC